MDVMRRETWLDGLGEWSWPRTVAPAVELVPAAWVPAMPVAVAAPLPARRLPAPSARRAPLPRPLRLARLVLLLVAGAATFTISSGVLRGGSAPVVAGSAVPVRLPAPLAEPFARLPARHRAVAAAPPRALVRSGPAFDVLAPPPEAVAIETDHAGSTIARITYRSHALGWTDTYLVYLPPGYRHEARRRYPVLYLLHGDTQPASSFLRLGLQGTLDRLIRTHSIAPMIAVMLQADGLPNNWRNTPGPLYNDYVSEVRQLTDRTLRTIPARASRGIAGYSMGGFGAMNVALAHLRSYSVVESWEGYFNSLSRALAADRPLLERMPLHAFVWGGRGDTIASSAEDAPWAAAMRAAGADARSAVYPGGHTFQTLEAHLTEMLSYAGRLLRS
jgi:enterochelin esterase-like enzyme